ARRKKARFSSAVSAPYSSRSGPAQPTARRLSSEPPEPAPSSRTRPAVARTRPARILSSVVLPLPFFPATATRPPDAENERPAKSVLPEKDFWRFSAASVVGTGDSTIPSGFGGRSLLAAFFRRVLERRGALR